MTAREKYKDIIDLPHHQSLTRAHMPMENRAAQFSPFAALTGYDDHIKEKARITADRIELDEEKKQHIDAVLQRIRSAEKENPEISVTYFLKDLIKEGGEYVSITGPVKKADPYECRLIMLDGTPVSFEDIYSISLV